MSPPKSRALLAAAAVLLSLATTTVAQVNIPTNLVVNPPLASAGGTLRGEYWRRPAVSIPTNGATNPTNRIDRLIHTFGPPTGDFWAKSLVYLGNDLTPIDTWLGSDAASYVGAIDNLDDGAIRLSGFINITNSGTLNLGTTSDDGSRITIGGIDVINNDGSHGDATVDTNVVFAAAGLYPIEITFWNGDWTSDGTGANLNHSRNPDPSVHGGANFHLRVSGSDITAARAASLFYSADQAITNGLVAYWDFDGDLMDSVKDFHGTARGTNAIPFIDGKAGFGKAIKLDGGNQFVEITGGNENELEFPGGSMSIAGWFKVDAFDTGWQALISKGEGTAYRVARRDPTGTIAYAGGVGEGPNNTPYVNDGQWHHFVAVTDANTNAFGTALYVDGAIYSMNAARPVITGTTNNLMIGENPGARNREWEGELDDIAIWKRVLTPAEVAGLYAKGLGKPVSAFLATQPQVTLTNNLVAYWDFDGDLLDSVKGFHGTARGTNAIPFVDSRAGFGKAIKLDGGNQFVEITGGNENDLEFPGGSMSIAGWFTVDAFDTGWQALISKGEGTAYRVARRDPTGTIAYAGGVGEGPNNSPIVNDRQWHHFVAVTDANTNAFGTALYVDGAIYSINPAKPALTGTTFPLMIGENPGARGREWEGQIDDIAIWNRVLTSGEVTALHSRGAGRPLSTLIFGPTLEPFKIGLNFGAAEYPNLLNAGKLSSASVAGIPAVAQANWNNLDPVNGTNTVIVADSNGSKAATTVSIQWNSNGTWANTGRGENNNAFATNSPNRILMTGYLDTGNATTSTVTITNIPPSLAAGYDVYIYAMGGVGGRGGGYRILDGATTNVLRDYVKAQSPTNFTSFVQVPMPAPTGVTHGAGNYIVFSGLTASSIRIQATTADGQAFGGTPRAPINAIQLVKSAALPIGPMIAVARNATGAPIITYTGTLQSSTSVAGPYSAVAGATSPYTVSPTDPARFYRVSQP